MLYMWSKNHPLFQMLVDKMMVEITIKWMCKISAKPKLGSKSCKFYSDALYGNQPSKHISYHFEGILKSIVFLWAKMYGLFRLCKLYF